MTLKNKTNPLEAAPTMRLIERRPQLSRRGFLQGTGLATLAAGVLPNLLATTPAFADAETFPTLGAPLATTLLRMARDLYPHDQLADSYYITALAPYDGQAKTDPALHKLLSEGASALDAAAQVRHHHRYAEIELETDRVALLQEMETTPFFQKIRGGLVTGLYNNKQLWPRFGYEGSSWQKGGYRFRGFDDLDWL